MAVESRQPAMFAAVTITLAAAAIALTLRFMARRMTKVPLWWDDFMCIGSFIFAVGWSTLLIMWAPHGFGLHLRDTGLTPEQSLVKSLLFCYLAELFYAFSLAFSKFGVLAFYWRMFHTSNIKIPIITLVVATWIWLILRTFLAIFHCVPVQAFWDKSIPDATCNIDDAKFFFGTVLVHLALDIIILTLPVLQVRKLQLRTAQKVGVTALFMFGILVCAASVVVLVYSVSYNTKSPEVSWNVAPIMTWATVEVNLAVVSACIPMLRPIFMRAFKFVFPNASVDSKERTYDPSRQKTSVKMSTVRSKTPTSYDSDSIHRLTDFDSDCGDHDDHVHGTPAVRVVITGNDSSSGLKRAESPSAGMGGIIVKSETSVQVTSAV